MKSIMISIKPKWCELIANGKKTIEVRKTRPRIETPFKCYIYCTKPGKKHQTVSGCMVLNDDELYRHPTQGIKYGTSIELMCRDDYTEHNFLNGKVIGEFVCDRILTVDCDSVAPFDKEASEYIEKECCVNRDEFRQYSNGSCCFGWHISDLVIYENPKNVNEFYAEDYILKRSPQSWCYCEEIENDE